MKKKLTAFLLSAAVIFTSAAVPFAESAPPFSIAAEAASSSVKIGGKSYSTNVKTLDLSGKGLEDSDIVNLKKMTKLTEIVLSDNDLTDLSVLSKLTTLKKVTFHNNSVSDLSFAKKLKNLTVIGADNNGITDISALSGLTKLKEVWMGGNKITDLSPLKKCTNITHLNVKHSPVKNISALSGMKKLNTVILEDCGLKSIKPLKGLKNLEYVYISDNKLTDLTPLADSSLVELYADNNNLKGNTKALEGVTVSGRCSLKGNGFKGTVDLKPKERKRLSDDYNSKYYYNTMTKRQKQIYKDIYSCVKSHKKTKKLTLTDVTEEEFDYVWWLFTYENSQFFWIDTTQYQWLDEDGIVTYLMPVYYKSKEEDIKKLEKKVNAKVDEIVAKALKEDSDFEVMLSLHDSLVKMTDYYLSGKYLECSAIGPLVNGRAQCDGYAKAFTLLCQEAGIPCIQVNGLSYDDAHAWNKVKLDGKWYNVDVTADDEYGNYSFFCISDEQIKDMVYSFESWLPLSKAEATSKEYNYYSYIGKKVYTDAEEAYKGIIEQAAANFKNRKGTTVIYCDPSISVEVYEMIDKYAANDLGDSGVYDTTFSYSIRGWVIKIEIDL